MTEKTRSGEPDWLPRLGEIVRGSRHETRNSLNGVVVNLEVVRSRVARAGGDPAVLPFAEQAVAQAEDSVKLNEAVAALLSLMLASVDASGRMRCAATSESETSRGIRFDVDAGTAQRARPGLVTLGNALGFAVETSGGAVIFTFPSTSSTESRQHE